MPYRVVKKNGTRPYKIIAKETGKVVGSSKSLAEARAAIASRYANESSGPTSSLKKSKI